MQKALLLAATILMIGYANVCCASQTVSATIMLAVYVAPATPTASQAIADTQTTSCTSSLAVSQTGNGATTTSCQNNTTNLTWTASNQNVQLVVAPI